MAVLVNEQLVRKQLGHEQLGLEWYYGWGMNFGFGLTLVGIIGTETIGMEITGVSQ
jgi:hypothetical protein